LWGHGGAGKPTIAAEIARELIEAFAMDVVWISADGRADFALSTLLDEMAAQLGKPEIRKLAPQPKTEAVRELEARRLWDESLEINKKLGDAEVARADLERVESKLN
jgi:CO dehydrogenase nickel-insertion accessory protein CooC1